MSYWAFDKNHFHLSPQEVNECGTACCFAGFGPVALKNVEDFKYWDSYIKETFGGKHKDFLFSAPWPNDKKQAATRALMVLKKSKPSRFWFDSVYHEDYSIKKLIAELEEFVIK